VADRLLLEHVHGARRLELAVLDGERAQLTTLPGGERVRLSESELRWLQVVAGPAALAMLREAAGEGGSA